METDDAAVVAGITTANLEASEPWKKANGGRNESSGTAGVECHEKTISEVKEIKASGSGADVSGAAKHIVFESGDRKNAEGGVLGQCSTERLEVSTANFFGFCINHIKSIYLNEMWICSCEVVPCMFLLYYMFNSELQMAPSQVFNVKNSRTTPSFFACLPSFR